MKFARYTFTIAGIYGILALFPQYFMEAKNGRDFPPEINHPEYYYGFIGTALAFQIAFLMIGRDPVRYRAMMIPSVVEKFGFAIAVTILFLQNKVHAMMFGASIIDLLLGILFIVSYFLTPKDYSKANQN